MDELLTCSCQMKTDLENSADAFSFFKENYPLSSLTNNKMISPNRKIYFFSNERNTQQRYKFFMRSMHRVGWK